MIATKTENKNQQSQHMQFTNGVNKTRAKNDRTTNSLMIFLLM